MNEKWINLETWRGKPGGHDALRHRTVKPGFMTSKGKVKKGFTVNAKLGLVRGIMSRKGKESSRDNVDFDVAHGNEWGWDS